jgi:hypothetical protein
MTHSIKSGRLKGFMPKSGFLKNGLNNQGVAGARTKRVRNSSIQQKNNTNSTVCIGGPKWEGVLA